MHITQNETCGRASNYSKVRKIFRPCLTSVSIHKKVILISCLTIALHPLTAVSREAEENKLAANGSFFLASQTNPAADRINNVKPSIFSVLVNGENVGETTLVQLSTGELYARVSDLQSWRLRLPDNKYLTFEGNPYYPIGKFAKLNYEVDSAKQEISLSFPAESFSPTFIQLGSQPLLNIEKASNGAFANYDLFLNKSPDLDRLDGQFEMGYFNQYGVGVGNFLAQQLNSHPDFVRLETSWTKDSPSEMKTLVIGDAIGSSGLWGRPIRYGGIHYGTNFSINPTFIKFPLPRLSGEAVLPSSTELYIDGVKKQSLNLPAGPFEISSLPVLTGKGEIQLVEKDLLGRQKVITVPYYASNQLLTEGLVEESYEIGFARRSFGISSNDYGRFVSTVQIKKGFSSIL